jgi:PIN domain nuclease of toxin-antitoxin system
MAGTKRLLLDTHAFLWFIFDDAQLSRAADAAISDEEAELHLSIVSLWEIVIKSQLDKLSLGMSLPSFFGQFVESRQLTVLPIDLPALVAYHDLPLHHRDPFDRLLIAQARVQGLKIVTSDRSFAGYDVDCLW